jgi:epsilon-lactone hydrolase
MKTRTVVSGYLFAMLLGAAALGQHGSMDADGTVHVPAGSVPLSNHMSAQAKQQFIEQNRPKPAAKAGPADAACPNRDGVQSYFTKLVERTKTVYPVTVHDETIGGVHTNIVEPSGGLPARNRARVLINLHGGSFSCATTGGLLGLAESIPVAGAGQFKVVAVDYRSLPNAHFPAATEDVTAVYKALLKSYPPENIGIFGTSTGASLTSGVLAWLQKENLPRPGAVGLFAEGANKDDEIGGDALYIASAFNGQGFPTQEALTWHSPYFSGTSERDPLVAPVNFPEVLARFPPTLLLSGTRDLALSEVLYTHTRLVAAGANAELHVWDGMGHGFYVNVDLPESQEALSVISKFFDLHLRAGTLKEAR